MKKVFFLTAMSLFCLLATAQVKISNSTGGLLSVEFKRCIVQGTEGYIDLVLGNRTAQSIYVSINSYMVKLYDDEGEVYTGNAISSLVFGGSQNNGCSIPKETVVKFRINFANVNEYAAMFSKAVIQFYIDDKIPAKEVTLSDVPIIRRE